MTDNHIDVLINGCGIGGAMLAYLLGRQGHRVVVVEQARRERAINGADLLKPAGIRVVEAAGLLAEVTRRGGRVRHELEVYHDGELLRYFNYSSVDARGYFILMPCESLRRLVLEKIDGEATVEMLFETRIEAVQRDERHAIDQVRLNDGRVLRPRVVVGADGIASYVRRRLLDIEVERHPYPSPMLVGTFALAPCVAERNRLYVDSQGGLAYFYPIGFDRARLVVSFPREESRELMADTCGESLRRRLQRFVGDESAEAIAAVTGTSRFKGIPIGYLNLDRYWADNVAMLGDAIHNVHPITGQGMNLAIEDASASPGSSTPPCRAAAVRRKPWAASVPISRCGRRPWRLRAAEPSGVLAQAQRVHQPGGDGHAHQLRQGLGLHALHHPRAVEVDGLHADFQLLGHLAAGIAAHQRQEHVALARGEAVQAFAQPGVEIAVPAPTGVAIEGLLHAVEQQLFVVGFLDEIHRPGLEGAHHDGHVGMAADEDHRQVDAARQQFVLHVQPAHAGHPHVEQDAGMAAALAGVEEVPALGEGPCLETDRFQQPDRRFEHALVVVDHVDQRFVRHSHP